VAEKVPKTPYLAVRIVKPEFGRTPVEKSALPDVEDWVAAYRTAYNNCKDLTGYERRKCMEREIFNEIAKKKGINKTYDDLLKECEVEAQKDAEELKKKGKEVTETWLRAKKARCMRDKVEALLGKVPANLLVGRVREVIFELVLPKKWLLATMGKFETKGARGREVVRIANARFDIRNKLDYELYEKFINVAKKLLNNNKAIEAIEKGEAPTIEVSGIDAVRMLGLVALLDRAGRSRGALVYLLNTLAETESGLEMLRKVTAELGHVVLTTMLDIIKAGGVAWIRGRNVGKLNPDDFDSKDIVVDVPDLPRADTVSAVYMPFLSRSALAKMKDTKEVAKVLDIAVGKVEEAYARAYRHLVEDFAKVWLQSTNIGVAMPPFTDKRGKLNTLGIVAAARYAVMNHKPLDKDEIKTALRKAMVEDEIIKGLVELYNLYRELRKKAVATA
jgi:hypothetical protein